MSTITIELPEPIHDTLRAEGQELSRLTLESLAVEGYRRAVLSGGQVGEMLGLDYWQTRAFLTEHRVYPQYDVEDFEQDLATLACLGQGRQN